MRTKFRHGRIRLRYLFLLFLIGGVAAACLVQVDYVVTAPCEIGPTDNRVIRSPIDGFVQDVYVEEGQSVKKGDLLAKIVDDNLAKQIDILEARCLVYERKKLNALVDDPVQYQVLSAAQQAIQKEIDLRRKKLAEGTLRAPFDGIVFMVKIREVGERNFSHPQIEPYMGDYSASLDEFQMSYVRLGTGIMHLAKPSPHLVKTYIRQGDLAFVSSGQPVECRLLSYPDKAFRFKVVGISETSPKDIDNPGVTQEGTGSIPTQRERRRRLFESQIPLVSLFLVTSILKDTGPEIKWGMTGKAHIQYGHGPVGVFWATRFYRFARERLQRIF